MMEMQELKERRRTPVSDPTAIEAVEEVEPSVLPTAPFLNGSGVAHGVRRRQRSSIELAFSYVFERLWSLAFFTIACFGLYETQFVHEVLYARHADRTFVMLFIASSTLVVLFGCYIEIYRNLVRGDNVSYETAKSSTHGMLLSMVAAGICFTIGMWPVWHWLTIPYLFMWFWGVIVQAVVIFPVQAQRVLFGVAYLWFMHSYLSLFVV